MSSLTRPLLPRAARRSRRRRSPASRSSVVGVGDRRVAHLGRAAGARSMPASTEPTWRNVAVLGRVRASTNTSRAANCGSSTTSGTDATGATQVSAGPELGDPVVAVARRERGAEVGADLVLHGVVGLVRRSTARSRARGRGWRRTAARWRRPRATCRRAQRVDVVAGVAAGEDVVAGPGHLAGGEVLVDVRATSARARRRRPTRRGTRPRRCAPRCTSAARIAITACMPPPALSATVAPGQRRAAVGVAARSSRGSRRPRGS